MVVQIVRFKSGLPDERVRELFEERSSRYRKVPGLLQKLYLRYPDSGEHGAVYVWESHDSIEAFRRSELGRSIGDTYRVDGEKVVANADVLLTLRPVQA